MTLKTIEKEETVNVKYFFENMCLRDFILKVLSKKLVGKCDKEYGYIINVKNIKEITGNNISSINCNVIFNVLVELDVILPVIDTIYDGEVCLIFEKGIFLDILKVFKVLIPFKTLNDNGYEYDSMFECFKNKEGNMIMIGNNVKVEIEGVKYSGNKFNCFGRLV